uniref:AIG1-type G domain-containing protein n=1 Tax=Astatotilapia calliptera TaxID=8154 RepID=A0AAX7UJ19_ASTCA
MTWRWKGGGSYDSLKALEKLFGPEASNYMIVVFTHGDKLAEQKSIQEYLTEGHPKLKEVVSRCGNRYYVFNNKDKNRNVIIWSLHFRVDAWSKPLKTEILVDD